MGDYKRWEALPIFANMQNDNINCAIFTAWIYDNIPSSSAPLAHPLIHPFTHRQIHSIPHQTLEAPSSITIIIITIIMGCSVGGYTSIAGEMSCPPQSICSEVSIHYIFIHNRIYSCARHGMRFMAACHVLNSFLVIAVRHPPTTDRYSGLNRLRKSLHRPRPAILQLRFFPGPVFVFHSSVLSTPATKCTFGGRWMW